MQPHCQQRPGAHQPVDAADGADRWQQPQRRLAAALAGVAATAALLVGTPLDVAKARPVLTQDEKNTIALFQRSRPSVVYITSLTTR